VATETIALIVEARKKGEGTFKETNRFLAGLGSKAKTAGKLMAGGLAIGGGALAAFGIKAIGAASDVEEMQSKFDTVFKNVGPTVTKALDEFSAAAGRNKFELRGMAAELGDLFKPLGFAETEAGDLSVQMVKLATDLSSFNNMPMDEALQRLRGTLIGSHENALAFGVVINENTLKAEMAAQGWDKLTGAAFEQAKVQARLNLLMAGTSDRAGRRHSHLGELGEPDAGAEKQSGRDNGGNRHAALADYDADPE